MKLNTIDPLVDPRWRELVETHPDASCFHHSGWMRALRDTYGYSIFALTTAGAGEPLRDGLPVALIRSAFAPRRRLVSLPFVDHCEPLSSGPESMVELLNGLAAFCRESGCRFAELRPLRPLPSQLNARHEFGVSFRASVHEIDLSPPIDQLFRSFNEGSIIRKIRKAEREKLRYDVGTSDALLDDFFALTVVTRRRHKLPPQPRSWFRNLLDSFGGSAKIHVAYKDELPLAAILTCAHGKRYVYKYGCSHNEHTNLGATPLVVWHAIQEAKIAGYEWFDLGRTDIGGDGLAIFKERWSAQARPLEYFRSPAPSHVSEGWDGGVVGLAKPLFARLPNSLLIAAGRILYRHMG